jgi:hypothetical protein
VENDLCGGCTAVTSARLGRFGGQATRNVTLPTAAGELNVSGRSNFIDTLRSLMVVKMGGWARFEPGLPRFGLFVSP